MALTKCGECGKEISDKADTCPHCGAKPKKSSGCLVVIVSIIGVIIVSNMLGKSSTSSPPTEVDLDAAAGGTCMFAIKSGLHDPSSAEFEHSSSTIITKNGDTWTVVRPVRAKNGFGAIRRSMFACTLIKSGDRFSVKSVSELQ